MQFVRGAGVRETLDIGHQNNFSTSIEELNSMSIEMLRKIHHKTFNCEPCVANGQPFLSYPRHIQIQINNEVVRVLNRKVREQEHQKIKSTGIVKGSIRKIRCRDGSYVTCICSGTFDTVGRMKWYSIDRMHKVVTNSGATIEDTEVEQQLLDGLVEWFMREIRNDRDPRRMGWGNYNIEIHKILVQLKLIPKPKKKKVA